MNLYTEKQISEMFNIAVSTLRCHRSAKKGIPYVKIGSLVRYEQESVEEYLKNNTKNHSEEE